MFKYAGLNIGFKPDLKLRTTADVLIGGKDIELILPHVITGYEAKSRNDQNDYAREVLRRFLHMAAFLALSIWIFSPLLLFLVLLILTIAYIFSESLRMDGIFISPITKITQRLGRKEELHLYMLSPVYLAIGILTPLLFFPPPSSYVAVTVLALGDGVSPLIGLKLGRHRIPYNKSKSFEGSISGFIVAFAGSCLFVSPFFAIIAALSGMIIESLPLPLDDNISIPLSVGLILSVLLGPVLSY
jgi:dolichol kinase